MRHNTTDNARLESKIELRRQAIGEVFGEKKIKVFDACCGDRAIWSVLRKEIECDYFGVDEKPGKSAVRIRSERLLQVPGLQYDVIDVDTYGQPWRHYKHAVTNTSKDVLIFLTVGMVMIGGSGNAQQDTLHMLRLPRWKCPKVLFAKVAKALQRRYVFWAETQGMKVECIWTTEGTQNVDYMAVHLKKT